MERSLLLLLKVWRHEVPHSSHLALYSGVSGVSDVRLQQIADRLLAPQTAPANAELAFLALREWVVGGGWPLFSHCHHRTWGQEVAPGAAVFEL
jgi:hypothetical protein